MALVPAGNAGDQSGNAVMKNPNGDARTYVPTGVPTSIGPAGK